MYKKFFRDFDKAPKHSGEFNCGENKVVSLGFQTADERINCILQAGQVLQEARASQYTYQNVNADDDMSDHNDDYVSPQYMDSMECSELASVVSSNMQASLKQALVNNAQSNEIKAPTDETTSQTNESAPVSDQNQKIE